MYKSLIVGFCVIAVTLAIPTSTNLVEDVQSLDCWDSQDTELFSCMAVKAVTALDRAARSNDIQILDGVTFARTTPMERSGRALKSELEVMNELPRDASEKSMKLVNMMYDSMVSFFKSHSLKFDIPEESRALIEGRAKGMKKMIFPLIAAVGVKLFALVPILLGGLGLLIMKALFVSKIALLLAGVLAFQKLFGANGGAIFGKSPIASGGYYDAPANGGWSTSGSSYGAPQGYYKRSFDEKSNDPQTMAYSAHAPTESEKEQ